MPNGTLELKDLEGALRPLVEARPLSDKTLDFKLASTETEESLPLSVEGLTFSIGGKAEVFLFNAKSDVEGDEVLGAQVDYSASRAWLKYRLEASAKGEASLESGSVGLTLSGDARAIVASYRTHAPESRVWEALVRDLTSPRFVFSLEQIKSLQDGEAVTLQVPAKLALAVSVSWSDLLSNNLSAIGRLLDVGSALAVNVEAAAKAHFSVSLDDDFFIAFSRTGDDIRMVVRKARKRTVGAGASLGVAVELADEDGAAEALTGVLTGLLGKSPEAIRNMVEGKTFDQLGEEEKQLIEAAAKRLGLAGASDKVTAVLQRIGSLAADAKELVEKVAAASVTASFAYEYGRISTHATVLDAVFPVSVLDEHHKRLLRGDLASLLRAAAKDASPIQIRQYLRSRKVETSRSYGFDVSVAGWALSGKDEVETSLEVVRKAEGSLGAVHEQVCMTEHRGYAAALGKDAWQWALVLDGTMDGFSAGATARADELACSLTAVFEHAAPKLGSRVLAEVVDLARVWGIIGAGHVASERQRLRDLLDGAKDVTASCEVKVSRLAFRSLVGELGHADARAFGKALGRAMPWWRAHREVRTVEMREKWYGALWRKYLEDEHVDAAALASIAERTLKPHFYDLALDEGQALTETAIAPITVAGLAFHNRSLRRKWAEASEAALAVSNAIASHGSHAAVRAGMKRMRVLGEQQHWTRAVGAYTARLLESRPFLASDVDRVMSIKYTKNGTSQVELVTAAS